MKALQTPRLRQPASKGLSSQKKACMGHPAFAAIACIRCGDSRWCLGVGVASAAVGWRVFRHGLVDLFAALRPGFGTLLPLLVQLVLGTQEFDVGLFGSVTLLETSAHDAQIAAGTISIARGYGV